MIIIFLVWSRANINDVWLLYRPCDGQTESWGQGVFVGVKYTEAVLYN